MAKANILVVENESIVALNIQNTLEKYNYKIVTISNNGEDTLKEIETNLPDIILMDIDLGKGKNGIQIVSEIKEEYPNICIIYLTAHSDEKTIQDAINTNPHGYIIKPFVAEELNASIQLAIYKMKNENKLINNSSLSLGKGYFYDLKNEKLFYKEHHIKLSKNETQLLNLLIESNGNPMSHTDIEYFLWPDTAVNNDTLRALVYRLRTKLEHNFIETVPSFGYKLTI